MPKLTEREKKDYRFNRYHRRRIIWLKSREVAN